MKQFKNVNASIVCLKAVLASNSIKPEQRESVEVAIEQLRRLRRKPNPRMQDVYECVREITERLVAAFLQD